MAALSAEVDLFDHIQSMLYTTIPSATLASIAYFALGFIYPPAVRTNDLSSLTSFLNTLETMFNFNVLLLIPPAIVLYGIKWIARMIRRL
jgi:Na+:H+ antiporter, NhaC family